MTQQRERIVIRKTKPVLPKEQKAVFSLVIAAGCLALLLGSFYLVRHIAKPFFIEYTGEFYFTEDQEEMMEMMEQQVKDTDGDGLSDYDELYVHGSSPYLKDTDGDGYNDMTEVEAGTDIDCAAGETCYEDQYAAETELFEDIVPSDSQVDQEVSLADLQDIVTGMTADEIRDLLIASGADSEAVAVLTDDELKELMAEVLSGEDSGPTE